MKKILVSWLANMNDFIKGTEVNTAGPTMNFHRYHFIDYDKHYIMLTKDSIEKGNQLVVQLKTDFPAHKVELFPVDIANISDLHLVKSYEEQFLIKFRDYQIDIYFSPGSSIMQVGWYICHTSLGLHTRLVQLMRPEFSYNKAEPDLLTIDVEQVKEPYTAYIKMESSRKPALDDNFIMTNSIQDIYNKAYRIAQAAHVSVLIQGESGTGKEHLARTIHARSPRKMNRFEAINCAAMSDQLLEARLFGYKKGAFTGANDDREGLLEYLNGGTIFLDEIGDISPMMQVLLLRFLQEGEIQPIMGKVKKVDVRVIAATNKDLVTLCNQGKFRWDLYYRMAMAELELPSLEARGKAEKQIYLEKFLINKQILFKRTKALILKKEALDAILEYPFPGNLREMENLIDNLYVFCDKDVKLRDLPKKVHQVSNPSAPETMDAIEARYIKKALAYYNGNLNQTARALDIALNTLKSKIRKYQLR